MRYPPDAYKKEIKNKGQDAEDEKTIEELIKELEEENTECFHQATPPYLT